MSSRTLGERLKAMREAMGLSLSEAAQRLGYKNYQILSNIEQGKREVKASELVKFSSNYFCSLGSLLGQEQNCENIPLLWRNPPANNSKKMEIEKKIRYRCKQYRFLEELLKVTNYPRFPEEPIDNIRRNCDIDNLAVSISNLLKLGDRPAYSLQTILEFEHKVKILFYPFDEGSAVSLVAPDTGYVLVVNSNEAPWRRSYDIAHELFHLLTWKAIVQQCHDKEQCSKDMGKKAERFASALLLPELEVRKEINERIESQGEITYSDISDIAQSFGTSVQALCYRMVHLGFIKWEKANELAQDRELLLVCRRKRGKEKQLLPEPGRFYSLAIRCLRKGLISRGRFAEIVEIDRYDIDKFIEDRGLMASEGNKVEIMAAGC